jgi:hypothetical protein
VDVIEDELHIGALCKVSGNRGHGWELRQLDRSERLVANFEQERTPISGRDDPFSSTSSFTSLTALWVYGPFPYIPFLYGPKRNWCGGGVEPHKELRGRLANTTCCRRRSELWNTYMKDGN